MTLLMLAVLLLVSASGEPDTHSSHPSQITFTSTREHDTGTPSQISRRRRREDKQRPPPLPQQQTTRHDDEDATRVHLEETFSTMSEVSTSYLQQPLPLANQKDEQSGTNAIDVCNTACTTSYSLSLSRQHTSPCACSTNTDQLDIYNHREILGNRRWTLAFPQLIIVNKFWQYQ